MTRRQRLLLPLVGLLGGCAMMLHEATPPEVRQVIVPTSLDQTYHRAWRAAHTMGATVVAHDPQQHTFTAHFKRVIGLHVDVRRVEEGTQMTVTGTILPKQVALGTLTEVDEFLWPIERRAYEPRWLARVLLGGWSWRRPSRPWCFTMRCRMPSASSNLSGRRRRSPRIGRMVRNGRRWSSRSRPPTQ